jgi:hypothetical protein
LDFELIGSLLNDLEAEWTADQKQSVEVNTGLLVHPPVVTEFLADVRALRKYFDVPKDLAGDDVALLREYRFRNDIPRRQWSPELRRLVPRVDRERVLMRRQFDWVQEKLLKWGFVQGRPR